MAQDDLSGRVVVITGAGGGLGSALARALHDRGAKLALFDRDLGNVDTLTRAFGGDDFARGWRVDVRSYPDLEAAMNEAADHFGGIDIVIANSGMATVMPMVKMSPEEFAGVIDVNLNGVWRTFKAGLPHVTARRGYLLAISSMAAFVHSPLQTHYTASKAGVWAMCDSLRLELRHLGVAVGSAHPTFFRTAMMDQVDADPAARMLWSGNTSGVWKLVPIEAVVAGIIRGIERRTSMIVVPERNRLAARLPGLFQYLVSRTGYGKDTVEKAIALARPAPWPESPTGN